jgi:hypothetical protein
LNRQAWFDSIKFVIVAAFYLKVVATHIGDPVAAEVLDLEKHDVRMGRAGKRAECGVLS